jgi:hypothetical protein
MTLADFTTTHHTTRGGEEWDWISLKLSRRDDGHYKLELGEKGNGAFRTAVDSDRIKELLSQAVDRMEELGS